MSLHYTGQAQLNEPEVNIYIQVNAELFLGRLVGLALFCSFSHKVNPFLLLLVSFFRPTMKFLLEQKGK